MPGTAAVNKRFVILQELGQGGHGKVYRARDEQLDRVVAIKVFHDAQPEGERLMKEARTLCRLTHPGIISVHDVSRISIAEGEQTTITLSEDCGAQDEKLVWAMIMEDLGDTDPLTYVRQRGDNEALGLAADIADALQAAHASKIFHCDLNNSNVRVVRGKAKVFDFSLAARKAGRPYGTPAYRAPEQTRGEEPTDRTDVYGLGKLLSVLLGRGQLGTAGEGSGRPDLPQDSKLAPGSQRAVQKLLHRMLDPDPQKRPSMEEVAKVCRASARSPAGWTLRPWHKAAVVVAVVAIPTVIVLGRAWLPSRAQPHGTASPLPTDTFTVTVRVRGAASDPNLIPSVAGSKLLLDLGSDRRAAAFDASGEATFKEIPTRFRGQPAPVIVQAPGYVMLDGQSSFVLSGDPLYVSLVREEAPVAARLRVAIGIVHHGTDVLMVRRRYKEGKLSWQFPAGIVKPIQEPEQRIVDETLKETGISIKIAGKVGERISPETKVHAIYFSCEYLSGSLSNGEPSENAEVAWVPASDVTKYITSSMYQGVIDLLNEIKNGHFN